MKNEITTHSVLLFMEYNTAIESHLYNEWSLSNSHTITFCLNFIFINIKLIWTMHEFFYNDKILHFIFCTFVFAYRILVCMYDTIDTHTMRLNTLSISTHECGFTSCTENLIKNITTKRCRAVRVAWVIYKDVCIFYYKLLPAKIFASWSSDYL